MYLKYGEAAKEMCSGIHCDDIIANLFTLRRSFVDVSKILRLAAKLYCAQSIKLVRDIFLEKYLSSCFRRTRKNAHNVLMYSFSYSCQILM
jgi:hypothetical protein